MLCRGPRVTESPGLALGTQDELGLTTRKLGEKGGENVLVLQLMVTWSIGSQELKLGQPESRWLGIISSARSHQTPPFWVILVLEV